MDEASVNEAKMTDFQAKNANKPEKVHSLLELTMSSILTVGVHDGVHGG